ncbi:MAG: exosortase A [Betaproteobacteria bacterium HGW-Betaproteobacteria-21]|nr:MAG: exosortase A [Betaproteobacteria bacterium HGW-Betaproteobacteria-21]
MKPVISSELDAVKAVVAGPANDAAFSRVILTLSAVFAWCVVWYLPTASDIAFIWWRSDTYAHGLIVLPVFFWLVWGKREQIGGLVPEPVPWLAVPAVFAGFLWLLGQLVSVAAAAHAGFVLMVIIGLVAAIGWRLARVLLFPLAFLLFGIPIGDFLLPTLMDLTAEFTVWALRLSGVPVYQEGLHFVIPNGRWSVVEACSGIRYLIASVMVGSLYAYLNYVSLRKRLLFMLVALLVPIVANWLRAYMIVMLGYLSNNELAAGVDHLIYGWVFFGVVIMLMFWIGRYWSDVPVVYAAVSDPAEMRPRTRWVGLIPAAIVIAAFPPIFAFMQAPADTFEVAYDLPSAAAGWTGSDIAAVPYRPHYAGFRGESVAAYINQHNESVLLYSAFFAEQREGVEMVTWGNGLIATHGQGLNVVSKGPLNTVLGPLRSATVISPNARHAVIQWYVVNGRVLTRDWEVKVRLAIDRLLGMPDASMVFVLATPANDLDDGFGRLRAFVDAHSGALEQTVADAEAKAPQ